MKANYSKNLLGLFDEVNDLLRDCYLIDARLDVVKAESDGENYILAAIHESFKERIAKLNLSMKKL